MGSGAFDAARYGDKIADLYDRLYEELFDKEGAVEFLAALAGEGRALELGIGTGRIALPLRAMGVEVHGIDASEAMVERLREKPGGENIPVTIGDFADVAVEGFFPLIYVPFNTFFALPSQDDQLRCFRKVASRLGAGGAFVIEAFMPDPGRFDAYHRRTSVERIEEDLVQLEGSLHDPAAQRVLSTHIFLSDEGTRLVPIFIRYAWPSELDLMAKLAGLELKERWGGWRKEPFTSDSKFHVSVYGH